jgi:cytoskeletal protein RodZ
LWGEFLVHPAGLFVGAFGEKFREERERRGITLDDVSNVTKISSRMLQAIEQERFDVLPGGVFNKGFIRAYAKTLGFNTEEAISEYLTALRQAQLDAQNAAWDHSPAQKPASSSLEPLPRVVTSTVKSSNAPETKVPVSLESAAPVPAISVSQDSGRSMPLQSSSLQSSGPAFEEFPLPQPLVQPPPQSVPPPLWISPPSSSKRASPPRDLEPPAVLESAFARPPTVEEQLPSQQTSARQESGAQEMQSGPQVLIEEPQSAPISDLAIPVSTEAAPAAALQPASAPRWKTPALILAFGVLIIAAILWMRHPRQVMVVAPAVKTDSLASAQAAVVVPAASSSNKASPLSKPQPSGETDADNSGDQPASPVATAAKVAGHAAPAKAQAPPPFRVAIRASENCWISVTADGALVSRENMIAPANTSVKASHEIVVQVSNPAAISFRWNDHPISAPGAEADAGAGAKTFVFDSTGLRNAAGAGDSAR